MSGYKATPLDLKIVIAGLGGQGIIFITRLLAQAAVILGQPVMVSETHGMSQRGGSVISHLKVGGSEAPLIRRGTADLLIGLAPEEALRNLPFLRRGGVVMINSEQSVEPGVMTQLAEFDIRVLHLPASRIAGDLGSAAIGNVVLIGFAAAHSLLPLSIDALKQSIIETSARRRDLNLQAFDAGLRAGSLRVGQNLYATKSRPQK